MTEYIIDKTPNIHRKQLSEGFESPFVMSTQIAHNVIKANDMYFII